VLQLDLNRDGRAEIIVWKTRYDIQPNVYSRVGGQWKCLGYLTYANFSSDTRDLQALLASESYAAQLSAWDELTLGTARYKVFEDESTR
jgi:hypothetical protein